MRRPFLILIPLFLLFHIASAQILNPVKWTFTSKDLGNCEAELVLHATIDKGWHLYSQKVVEDGPVPTSFVFTAHPGYEKIGATQEGKPIVKFEKVFDAELSYFEHEATFKQKIKIRTDKDVSIKGSLEFMVCDDGRCLPPETVEFEFKLKGSAACAVSTPNPNDPKQNTPQDPKNNTNGSQTSSVTEGDCDCDSIESSLAYIKATLGGDDAKGFAYVASKEAFAGWKKIEAPKKEMVSSCDVWGNLLEGAIWGLLAMLTPCVYSMIPLTVSFFTKQSKSRQEGIRNALLYGTFIIVIFVALALLITVIFGPDALNEMASNIWANLFFFAIFMVFAASFLGAFEITLPSSWVNKADHASNKGGMIGIFFMAFTLVLVSFSCTGPFVGNLLVLVDKGSYLCPAIGMFGFAFMLALPFMLFALFPGWLNSMPKSGGWLNAVKVCLGLLEIALAMKFFSNADLVGGWHLVTRELFLAIWIAVFGIMAIYLFGKLKFSHDSDLPYLSVTRTMLAITVLSFTIYLIPGLWGAPVKLISGFPPPSTQEWSENTEFFRSKESVSEFFMKNKSKGSKDHASCPHGLHCFHDYFEALEYARSVNKPLMVDFTGWTCVNCRKMEENVWIDPKVLSLIREEYVLVSLYVDDRNKLPENLQYTSPTTGKKVKTQGNLWHDLQITRYDASAQPFYVLLDHEEKTLNAPVGYTPNIQDYTKFLEEGVKEFKAR